MKVPLPTRWAPELLTDHHSSTLPTCTWPRGEHAHSIPPSAPPPPNQYSPQGKNCPPCWSHCTNTGSPYCRSKPQSWAGIWTTSESQHPLRESPGYMLLEVLESTANSHYLSREKETLMAGRSSALWSMHAGVEHPASPRILSAIHQASF